MDRRAFLRRSLLSAAGLTLAGPLSGLACRPSAEPKKVDGYGPLHEKGDLALPRGFEYRVVSRSGAPMDDGEPTPGLFDGMAAFPGPDGTTVLIRNHENRERSGEREVLVPARRRYDPDRNCNGGCTKLVVSPRRRLVESFAVLGGTSTNCAGGAMPWGSWVTCEEVFEDGGRPHGFAFEIDARAPEPVPAVPIEGAGRFVHEAVAWSDGALYLTEDRSDAAFYRFVPDRRPQRPGDLAASRGRLQALRIRGRAGADTSSGWEVGRAFEVRWVDLDDPVPEKDTLRYEAHDKGAARFEREEGIWAGRDRVWFDCTDGGREGLGQVWEYDTRRQRLTLIYESPGRRSLSHPDNLVVTPDGGLLLCEDTDHPQFIRGLTRDGGIYDFARAVGNDSEFCGATFGPDGRTLFVNQQGDRSEGTAVTYAIWGPWEE
jgi:hypothetical protein